jgi:hypothetical protein
MGGHGPAPLGFGAVASLIEALIPVDQAADGGARKIRPKVQKFRREAVGRVVPLAFAIGKLGHQLGFFERLLMDGLAFGPQRTELRNILLNGAVDALLIESKQLKVFAFGDPGVGFG